MLSVVESAATNVITKKKESFFRSLHDLYILDFALDFPIMLAVVTPLGNHFASNVRNSFNFTIIFSR